MLHAFGLQTITLQKNKTKHEQIETSTEKKSIKMERTQCAHTTWCIHNWTRKTNKFNLNAHNISHSYDVECCVSWTMLIITATHIISYNLYECGLMLLLLLWGALLLIVDYFVFCDFSYGNIRSSWTCGQLLCFRFVNIFRRGVDEMERKEATTVRWNPFCSSVNITMCW